MSARRARPSEVGRGLLRDRFAIRDRSAIFGAISGPISGRCRARRGAWRGRTMAGRTPASFGLDASLLSGAAVPL